MAYGMENIAGMLARGGAMTGQAIGAPLAQFGQNIGGMLTARAETQQKQTDAAEVQKLLEQNKDNPAQLNALYQKYASEGKTDLANLFKQAAESAKEKRQAFVAGQEARLERGRERAEANKDLVAGMDDELKGIKVKKAAIELARENKDSNAVKMLAKDALDPQEYINSKFKSTGSKPKATIKEVEEIVNGKPTTVFYAFDESGQQVSRTVAGQVVDEEGSGKPFIQTAEGSKAYREVVASANVASSEVGKYSNLLSDAEDIFSEQQGSFLNTVGGYFGTAREFVVNDVAGLGDEITIFRTRLNEVQMQNAIKLLPRGPASDRDVALALSASVDPKNLKGEKLLSYLRGMKKIAEAEQEYMQGKVAWIEQTGDPNALGYERYAAVQGAQKKIAAVKADYGPFMSVVEDLGAKAQQAYAAGDTAKAEEYKMLIREVQENNKANGLLPTDFDVFSLFENLSLEQARYQQFAEKNDINYF